MAILPLVGEHVTQLVVAVVVEAMASNNGVNQQWPVPNPQANHLVLPDMVLAVGQMPVAEAVAPVGATAAQAGEEELVAEALRLVDVMVDLEVLEGKTIIVQGLVSFTAAAGAEALFILTPEVLAELAAAETGKGMDQE